jgi:CheY-like chemotaxis protein
MVVDDNQDIRNLLAKWLTQVGYEIVLAKDGVEAIEAFKRERPKMLFLDMLLPKKNGIEICKILKSAPESKNVPIVMMTAVYKGMQYATEAKKNGADYYIEKPFQNDKILDLAHKFIGPPEIQMIDEISVVETTVTSKDIELEGKLKNTNFATLLKNIDSKKLNGELRIQDGTAIKSVYFLDGAPAYTASNQISDRLGITVLKKGLITKDQYDDAVRYMQQGDGSIKIGQALILLEYINEFELAITLREQYKNIIMTLFSWTSGDYKVIKLSEVKRQRDALEETVDDLIIEGITTTYNITRIKEELKTLDTVFILSQIGKSYLLKENIKLKHKNTLKTVDGNKTLKEIINDNPEKGDETVINLYALYLCGFLAIQEIKEAQSSQGAGEGHSITKEMIVKKFNSLQDLNYYQLLNIDPKANSKDIKKAYFKLAKLYHPDKFLGNEFVQYKDKIEEIFNKISHSYKVLSSVSKRREYTKTMSTPKENRETIQKFTKIRNAEMRFIEGRAAFQRAKYDEAIKALQWAIDINPDEAEYHRYMGMALMRKYPPGNQLFSEAESNLLKSLELKPEDPQTLFWLGQYYKNSDKNDLALKYFKQSVEIKPNYHEATREIRLFEMRENKTKKKGGLFKKN